MYAFFYYKKYLFLLKNVFVAFFYDAIAWTNFLIYSKLEKIYSIITWRSVSGMFNMGKRWQSIFRHSFLFNICILLKCLN